MRYGIIDLGSNSMRLLLADYENGCLYNREKIINTTRLGKGIDQSGNISNESMEINLKSLEEFNSICKEKSCDKIYCMGTAALRNAKNSSIFVKKAKERIGLDIQIIDGEKEALLGFLGVICGISELDSQILVVDIGGGSTEFIIGDSKGIQYKKSLNIGALSLSDKFIKSYPTDASTIESIEKEIKNKIFIVIDEIKKIGNLRLIGIGGTITSISAIEQELGVYSMDKIHMSKIRSSQIANQINKIKKMSIEEIRQLKGLQKKRAEIILCGEMILYEIIKSLCIEEILVSEYDNLEGYIKNMDL
ncbi:Ppx/GppA family phosphatase [Peptostreptococcus equinus]|uniref:Ppx/GppA family phosphatase n=1 Tax=Peptostreptococcus equinus TaxID=3003601 RepID=A0ABY7JPM0_9FIRM|nr:Ppx/GppA family phosphatase [Peptostreptococcus sp. CBA3647]WAW15050.1 Ppx/GppA family phosphatase [Peptostreptococcus sp. CBA3647]